MSDTVHFHMLLVGGVERVRTNFLKGIKRMRVRSRAALVAA